MSRWYGILSHIGQKMDARVQTAAAMLHLQVMVLTALFRFRGRRRLSLRQIVDQVLFTGVDACIIISIIGLLCGVIISVQAMTNMPRIGAGEYFGNLMVIAVVRELGPFFTALVVIGRSGAALAAYIGTMRVNNEIAALEVMGINITQFLILPAFLGMIISLVCLNVYFDCVAVVGGLLVAGLAVNIPFNIFLGKVIDSLTIVDIIVLCVKNILFGATIAIVSCHHGLSVDSVRIIPRAVFRAVVGSLVIMVMINVAFTVVFYAR